MRLFAVASLGLLLLAACTSRPEDERPASPSAPTETGPPVPGDWVVQAMNSDPDSLNPVTGQESNGSTIRDQLVCEGMLQTNPHTLKLEPCMAESWEISPDQLTYTFHLRHGVTWHDGVPFTAEDVKFTYDRIQDPKVDCAPIRTYFSTLTGCEVLDPYTIRFTARERYFKTLEVLGSQAIVPRHVFAQGEPDFNRHPFARAPIGTGPYKFVRWKTGEEIVLERNDGYWAGPGHYPRRLVFRIIQEPYVTAQLLKKGEIDVDIVTPLQWERELKQSRALRHYQKIVYPYPAYSYLGFNLREPLFRDIRVRHAIDLLIPRDEILKTIYLNTYADKASGIDSPSSLNYNHEVAPTPNDPALAARLLEEAGWRLNAADGLRHDVAGRALDFTLLYPSGNVSLQKVAELIQEALASGGVRMRLSRLEFAQLIGRVDDWKFEATMAGWALDLNGDPNQLWNSSQAVQKKSSNFIGYANPEADRLMAAGRLEYDDEKRAAIYRQLHRLIHDDYPVCFLFNPRQIVLVSERFRGVQIFAPRPCFDVSTWWVPTALQKYR